MVRRITRREMLVAAGAAGVGMMITPYVSAGKSAGVEKVAMGFIGVGARGTELLRRVLAQHPEVVIPAVCDIDEAHLKRAQDLVEKGSRKRPEGYVKGPEDYRRLLAREDLNCVLIGTPQELHARMTLDSFAAGKFVGAEVPACTTLPECFELVAAQKKSGVGYMLLENLIYTRPHMQVWNMAEQGAFGELTYGAGAYIHEVRHMRFTPEGKLTWRGENVLSTVGVIYPTHAMGPVCRWMGIGRQEAGGKRQEGRGDRLKTLVAMDSKAVGNHEYAVAKFGAESEQAKLKFANGDTNHALVRTEQGRLIEIRYDTASPRPSGMGEFSLQGGKGAYEAALGQRMVYLEGSSKGEKWETLEKYQDQFEHSMWKRRASEAEKAGHWGADFFVIEELVNAVKSGVSPIDVVDGVTWSCVRPLSAESIRGGYKPVEVPDFTKG